MLADTPTKPQKQGQIEEVLSESGKVIEVSHKATDKEGLAAGLANVILGVLGENLCGAGAMSIQYDIRKAKGDKPRRIVIHAEHTQHQRTSVLVSFGPMPDS